MVDAFRSYDDEHEAFAARLIKSLNFFSDIRLNINIFYILGCLSRSSQYVYVPARDQFFTALDQHADTLEGDSKLPLVILGGEGMRELMILIEFNLIWHLFFRER